MASRKAPMIPSKTPPSTVQARCCCSDPTQRALHSVHRVSDRQYAVSSISPHYSQLNITMLLPSSCIADSTDCCCDPSAWFVGPRLESRVVSNPSHQLSTLHIALAVAHLLLDCLLHCTVTLMPLCADIFHRTVPLSDSLSLP